MTEPGQQGESGQQGEQALPVVDPGGGSGGLPLQVGDRVEVLVGPVGHGGFCVARHEGVVLFVRHTLPGERVVAEVTDLGPKGRYLRADAVEVLRPSPHRVQAPCPFSGPGRCGGCDWQHASLEIQRVLKAEVVAEQLRRLAGVDARPAGLAELGDDDDHDSGLTVRCESVPGDQEGLRWRTRVEFAVDPQGRVGLRAHRSHRVVPVDDCPIAAEGVVGTGVLRRPAPAGVVGLDVVAPSRGEAVVVPLAPPLGRKGRGRRDRTGRVRRGERHTPQPVGEVPEVTEQVGEHDFTLSARGFWQVHPGAAATFCAHVMDWLDPQPGERALDLYAGVGLFAVPLAQAVGADGSVLAVEADRGAAASATAHLTSYPWARAVAEPTETALHRLVAEGGRAEVVVLDPPRTGAGREVVEAVATLRPRAVVYVACDPAALARDVATAQDVGLRLADLRVFDAFPMTHHVECLALLLPA